MSFPKVAMILAAGRGERMRPLTDHTPKPLLSVMGKPLICYHLEQLAGLGVERVVINLAWLGEKITQYLGNGERFGVQIIYSPEEPVLETAGGIAKALPLLGKQPFVVVNGDVWTDFDFSGLAQLPPNALAKLVMVPNPEHHPNGDFCVHNDIVHLPDSQHNMPTYTFSGMALYHPQFFDGVPVERQPLAPILKEHISAERVAGVIHKGIWSDVGTPERLAVLNQE